MTTTQKFYSLDGKVSTRKELETLLIEAKKEGLRDIVLRLSKGLNDYPDSSEFIISVELPVLEKGLNAAVKKPVATKKQPKKTARVLKKVKPVKAIPVKQQSKPAVIKTKLVKATPVKKVTKIEKPAVKVNPNSLASRMEERKNRKREFYKIPSKDLSEYLGNVEKKDKESVAITIVGGQGSMKTRLCFQIIEQFAQNYKVGHASIEEHPDSALYEDKAFEYWSKDTIAKVDSPEIKSIQDVHDLVKRNDVIVIDSFSKLKEMDKTCELDKDFRKKYDGKLFIIIYQQTSDGKMRGGSKSQFDGDAVCFVQKEPNYENNYAFWDKNRYQRKPLDGLHFNIFKGKIVNAKTEQNGTSTLEKTLTQLDKILSFNIT